MKHDSNILAEMLLKVALVLAVVCAPKATAWSLWSASAEEAESVRGRIKAIVVSDEDQQVYLRFASDSRPSESETYRLCPEAADATPVIRQAFDRGQPVEVQVRGVWNPCLSRVN